MIHTEEQVQKEAYIYSKAIFEPVKLSVVFNATHTNVTVPVS